MVVFVDAPGSAPTGATLRKRNAYAVSDGANAICIGRAPVALRASKSIIR
jgi:hypothetical protein